MARKPTGGKVGRPRAVIDWNLFEQLCSIQCTGSEIASVLKIHQDTLSDRTKEQYGDDYSIVYKRYSEGGKSSLRRNQFIQSKKNTTMAIWLGKQWLGQKDHEKENEKPPQDRILLLEDRLMRLEYENKRLRDADQSKASPVICGSDSTIQHMGGSDQLGENSHIDQEAH
jgi:hypothetical protein